MDNSIYLFAAFSITWSIIFIYIFRLFRSQKALSRQIYEIRKTLQKNAEWNDKNRMPKMH
ncbi:MAG: CcmD family protein [Deltaproteobacteria bacterium]|nr:CcmD family protein [Deltaproteobacteria bacterium]